MPFFLGQATGHHSPELLNRLGSRTSLEYPMQCRLLCHLIFTQLQTPCTIRPGNAHCCVLQVHIPGKADGRLPRKEHVKALRHPYNCFPALDIFSIDCQVHVFEEELVLGPEGTTFIAPFLAAREPPSPETRRPNVSLQHR